MHDADKDAPHAGPRNAPKDWYQSALAGGLQLCPATASNQLEMWQAETFNPKQDRQGLAWARTRHEHGARILHDLLWQDDPEGFKTRIDTSCRSPTARHQAAYRPL